MVPEGVKVTVVRVNQYDENFTIRFALYAREGEFVVESGTTAGIRGTKPDGNGYSADCQIEIGVATEENPNPLSYVIVSGDKQMTAAAGRGEFEITLYKDDKELNSANFMLMIEHAALDRDTIASDSKIKEFVEVYDRADEIITAGAQYASYQEALETTAQEAAQSAASAAESAQAASESVEEATGDLANLAQQLEDIISDAERDITEKRDAIVNLIVSANRTASEAMDTASNAANEAADMKVSIERIYEAIRSFENSRLTHVADLLVQGGLLYGTNEEGEIITNGVEGIGGGGGGGGGSSATSTMTIANTSGFNAKTIADGDDLYVSFTWTSVESDMPTGNGTLKVMVNNVLKATLDVTQGDVRINIAPYLSIGSNNVRLTVTDVYGMSRFTAINATVVSVSLSSSFDDTIAYEGVISFPYTPIGMVSKTIHFQMDGREIGSVTTSVSGSQMSFTIPQQTHGAHVFRCWFECEINGQTVRSNTLYYEITCIEPLNNSVIITSSFNKESVNQYSLVIIPFKVYSQNSTTTEVKLYINNVLVSTQTVDRTEQSYSYSADRPGETTFKIEAGGQIKTISFTVNASDVDIEPETEDLALYLTAKGRSNNEATRNVWEYGNVSATLSNFNWRQDGWLTDDDGADILRLVGDARVTIPYQLFGSDFKQSGKTIQIEFATRQVADYTASILSCMSGNIGLDITPQEILFKGAQTELNALYKDNEHITLTITVEKQNENRIILIYIDGIASKAIRYASGERFSQLSPVGITIGSNQCGIDIYNIRVYDNNLSMKQVTNNWIADTQLGTLMLERYVHNLVYDEYGRVDIAHLPSDLPYMIIECAELPQYKGDKKTCSGSYTDPVYPGKSFTFTGCQINVQGTSSAIYYFKNFDLQFKEGFVTSAGNVSGYGLKANSIPFNRFVIKADVASSESANNTVLSSFCADTMPYKTREQIADPRVRNGIEGVPIVMFWYNTDTQEMRFMGKYNFNLPKRAAEPYGYSGDMESWEFERNNSNNMKFKDDDFTTQAWDAVNQEYYPAWYDDWEARFPSDEWRDYTKLKELVSWVKSTDREQATNENLPEPVTYRLNSTITINDYGSDSSYTVVDEMSGGATTGYKLITFTKDTPAYRLSKFRAELADRVEIDSATYYYLFTEYFLMIDSRAKNMFIGFKGDNVTLPGSAIDRKAVFEPYDMDTAIGTNNSGVLMFGYSLEDTDTVSAVISGSGGGSDAPVFNAQDSVLWVNFRDSFRAEITQMYRNLRANGTWSYDRFMTMFESHQAKWPEAIYNQDAYNKYIVPLVDPVTVDESTGQLIRTDRYLTMLQGSKKWQRAWWLFNRQKYQDSKYITGDAANNVISLRLFNSGTLTLTPAIDLYVGVSFGGGTTPLLQRTTENTPATFQYTTQSGVTEMETWIYSADMITDVGDLSVFYPNEVDFGKATRLRRLQIGNSASGYSNANLRALNVQNSAMLEYIDCRNCPNLAITVDLEGSPRLEEAYFEGTAITGVDLADGGALETLHLPATITTLTLLNLTNLSDLTVASYANVSRLMLANMNDSVVHIANILESIQPNSQVYIEGLNMEAANAAEIDSFLDLLDTMRGVTRERASNGEWLYHDYDKAQVSGKIHTSALTGAEVAELQARYPYIQIVADHVTSYITYKSYDGTTTLKTVTCLDGVPQEAAPSIPSRSQTAQYTYTAIGWNTMQDASNAEYPVTGPTNLQADTTLYAAYTATVRTYTVTWKNSDNTTLETDANVPYGSTPHYDGSTPQNPTSGGGSFTGWIPEISSVTGNVTYTASYIPTYTVYFYNGSTLLKTEQVQQGASATPPSETPVSPDGPDYTFTGWQPGYTNIQTNTSCYAQYQEPSSAPTATTADGAYGVEWNYSIASSVLTRKGLAASFSDPTPATSVSGSGSSPFDNIAPWKDMKMYNVVGNTLVPSTDASFNPATNDTVVYIPEFYYTAYKDTANSKWLWAISPTELPGYKKHPGSGKYIGRYHTSGDSSAVYSKSGVSPLVDTTRTNFRTYSAAKSNGWRMLDYATWSALQMLYLVEFANFDSQTTLGKGWNTGSVGTMGGTDGAAYHTINVTGAHNQYRYVEDPFSNVMDWIDGFVTSSKKVYTETDKSKYGDTITGLTNTNVTLPSSNYISGFDYSENAAWAFIPNAASGSAATYVTDRVYSGAGVRAACVGGGYSIIDYYGFFYLDADNVASGTFGYLGSRLIYDPS